MMNSRSLLIVCLATLGLAVAGWGQADGKIAFLSDREGHNDLWIMNADGSDPVNLTQGQNCASPAWSPDGTKIAYIDVGADYSSDVWVIDADGGNPQRLTDEPVTEYISFGAIFWSEDGSSIRYYALGRTDIFSMALDGSGSSPMERKKGALEILRFRNHRHLSPDGTKRASVALQQDDVEGQAFFVIYNTEDRQITAARAITLSDQPNVDFSSPEQRAGWFYTSFPLTWAPNGTRVAFTLYAVRKSTDTSYDFSYSETSGEIWAVGIDGSDLVNLTYGLGGSSPAWQPVVPAATATSVESQSWGRIKSLLSH